MNNLLSIYYAQTVSPGTVLGMLEDAVGVNANEERIIGYLRQYVGNLNTDGLRNILRFVTGSVVCSTLKIVVTFNSLSGAKRRQIAHTCASSLELSWTYKTYLEFMEEMNACLANPHVWAMDAL